MLKLENLTVEHLGRAKKITVDKDATTIVEGGGKHAEIKTRIEQLKKQIEASDSDYDREKLQERLAKLAGGVAVISVGANTEAEMKQKKARVEDALHATRAAARRALSPAAAWPCCVAREAVEKARPAARGDEKIGVDIVLRFVDHAIKQIADNCGVDGSVIADEVSEKATNIGYDANLRKVCRHVQGRHRRSVEGGADLAGECRQHRRIDVDHRDAGDRPEQGGQEDPRGGKRPLRRRPASPAWVSIISSRMLPGHLPKGWPAF